MDIWKTAEAEKPKHRQIVLISVYSGHMIRAMYFEKYSDERVEGSDVFKGFDGSFHKPEGWPTMKWTEMPADPWIETPDVLNCCCEFGLAPCCPVHNREPKQCRDCSNCKNQKPKE